MRSRLLVVSSRARKATAGAQSVVAGVSLVRYSYESTGVEELYQLLSEEVQSRHSRLDSLAWLLSGSEKELFLSEIGSKGECHCRDLITLQLRFICTVTDHISPPFPTTVSR